MMTKSDDLAGQAVSKLCSFTKLKTTPDYPIMLCVLSHRIDWPCMIQGLSERLICSEKKLARSLRNFVVGYIFISTLCLSWSYFLSVSRKSSLKKPWLAEWHWGLGLLVSAPKKHSVSIVLLQGRDWELSVTVLLLFPGTALMEWRAVCTHTPPSQLTILHSMYALEIS